MASASTATRSLPFPTAPTPAPPTIPARSALRPQTSSSTISRDKERPMEASTSTLGPERPKTSPAPRQSYFDKYPRAKPSKEQVVAAPSNTSDAGSSRSKAARDRLRALKSSRVKDMASDSDDEPPPRSAGSSSKPQPAGLAFPSVDDSTDDNLAGSSSSNGVGMYVRRMRLQSDAPSPGGKPRTRPAALHKRSPSSDVLGTKTTSSRPPRSEIPRSHGHTQLARMAAAGPFSASDLPFIRTSTSSSYTQTTLADAEHEFVTTPKSSLYRHDGVMVAAPTSGIGVETMDALVQGMNGGTYGPEDADPFSAMFGGNGRPRSKKDKKGSTLSSSSLVPGNYKLKHHPLYQPPLPAPPEGVSLGTPKIKTRKEAVQDIGTTEEDRTSSNTASAAVSSSEREKEKISDDHIAFPTTRKVSKKTSLGGLGVPSSSRPSSSRSELTVGSSSRPSTGQSVITIREAANAGPSLLSRKTSRDRPPRPSRRARSRTHSSSTDVSPTASPAVESAPSIDDIIRKHSASPPTIAPSISEIIRTHAPAHARPKRPTAPPSSYSGVPASVATTATSAKLIEEEEEEVTGRSSIDSIAAEVQSTLRKTSNRVVSRAGSFESEDKVVTISSPIVPHKRPPRGPIPRNLHHAKSFGDRPRSTAVSEPRGSGFSPYVGSNASKSSPRSESGAAAQHWERTPSVYSGPAPSITPSTPISVGAPMSGSAGMPLLPQDQAKLELAQFLRSPRLTRLMTLRRHPHAGLTVSMADVGSPTGHPVIVYLGLGCVRYLIALYDEMAEALNLRLVCVDRWGLGRTGEPKNPEGRGLLEWAAVIEEVADTLGIEEYSVVAHSAGAPYALAGVLKCGERRVRGSVHLLAPWVSMSVDTGYRWLKYVPNTLIKTAQAAEWKVQGWKLGKPPTITYQAIGYDANAPISSSVGAANGSEENPSAVPPDVRSSLSTSSYDDLADFNGKYGSVGPSAAKDQGGSTGSKGKKKGGKSILSIFNSQHGSGNSTPKDSGSVKAESTRTSRANSIASSGAKTLPAGKSPTLKGLKSLSSLRTESSFGEQLRQISEPATPTPTKASDLPLPMPTANVGLGLGMDDEMMQWGARLQMLDEILPSSPQPQRTTAGQSTRSRSSVESRRKRSVSLTSATASRPTMDLELPPVPRLPDFATSDYGMPPKSPNTSVHSGPAPCPTPKVGGGKEPMSLANALLRASHAESLKGGTADLLAILERDSKPWGFSYADIKQPIKVWYGDRDEKIAVSSVRWMERVMKDCTLNIVKGGNHNLMTNAEVVVEVLESVARDWGEDAMVVSPSLNLGSPTMPSSFQQFPTGPTMSSGSSFYKRRVNSARA